MSFTIIGLRFLLLVLSIFFLIWIANKKSVDTINPLFCIVPVCTFLLCYLFTHVEIGLGIGFGLFAIFSILRFRTQSISLITIIFLFASITISILDCLFPENENVVLIIVQFILMLIFSVAIYLNTKRQKSFETSFDLTIEITNDFKTIDLQQLIANKINKNEFYFSIVSINYISKIVVVRVKC